MELSAAMKDRVVQMYRAGRGPATVCLELGIGTGDLYSSLRVDSDFAARCKLAKKVAIETVEAQLHELACDGNLAAIKFYLTNRRKAKWQEAPQGATVVNAIQVSVAQAARQIAESPESAQLALQALTASRPAITVNATSTPASPAATHASVPAPESIASGEED